VIILLIWVLVQEMQVREVVAQGNLECLLKEPKSLTGQYLKKEKSIPMPSKRLAPYQK
jgi:excinuclease UvrABC ATPase subunit